MKKFIGLSKIEEALYMRRLIMAGLIPLSWGLIKFLVINCTLSLDTAESLAFTI